VLSELDILQEIADSTLLPSWRLFAWIQLCQSFNDCKV